MLRPLSASGKSRWHCGYVAVLAWSLASGAAVAADDASPVAQASERRLPGVSAAEGLDRRIAPEDLQRELFHFADRYFELVGQATEDGIRGASSGTVRSILLATKVSYVSSAISVVSGPRPLDALRDLIVMVTLQRMVWEDGGDAAVPQDRAQAIAAVLRELEWEVLRLAGRVMPAEPVRLLRELIERWRREHRDQHYVAFIRFHNLGHSALADEIREATSSGGFLAPIDAVAREAHESRLLAERAVFLANRMPLIMGWQAELVYQRVAASPEAVEILGDLERYRTTIETIRADVGELPGKLGREGQAVVAEASRRIAAERKAVLHSLTDGAKTFGPVIENLALAATAARDATAGLERLSAQSRGTAPLDLQRVQSIVDGLAETSRDMNQIVGTLNVLLGKGADLRGLQALDRVLAEHEKRLLLGGVVLIALFGAVLTLALRFGRRPRRAI